MKFSLYLLFICSIFACSPQSIDPDNLDDQGYLVQKSFNRGMADNQMVLFNIKHLSKDLYNNRPDSLINVVEEIFETRRKAGCHMGVEFFSIDRSKLDSYLDALLDQSHLFPDYRSQTFHTLISDARELIESNLSENEWLKLAVLIVTIESDLLDALRSSFSDGYEFSRNTFYDHYYEGPEVGKMFKLFVAPHYYENAFDITVDSVEIKFNNQSIIDEVKVQLMGGVVYVEFTPEFPGTYDVKGIFTAEIKEEYFQNTEKFSFTYELK